MYKVHTTQSKRLHAIQNTYLRLNAQSSVFISLSLFTRDISILLPDVGSSVLQKGITIHNDISITKYNR